MTIPLAEVLASSGPLAPFARDLAEAWSPAATPREFAAREVLHAPDDPATVMYILCAGRVKITAVSGQGKELIIALLDRGDVVGELSPAYDGPHSSFAEALEAGSAWSVPRDSVTATLARNPRVALAFMQINATRSQALQQRLADLVFLEVPQRLAAVLVDLSGRPGDAVLLTHYDLAGLIGSTRETTTLFLNKFREAGWVRLDKRNVRVEDRAALTQMAEGDRALGAVDKVQGA